MRVLFVTRRAFPTISGMSVYGRNLVQHLVARGHDVTMLAQYRDDDGKSVYGSGPPVPEPHTEVVGIPSIGEVEGDFERDVEALIERMTAIAEEAPVDVIHAQYGYPPGAAALEAGRRLGLPVIVSIQGGDGHWIGSCCAHHRYLMRTVISSSSRAIIGSRSFRGEVAAANAIDESSMVIVPGATDVERFTPPPDAQPSKPVRTILFHGRIDRRKGVFELLSAFRASQKCAGVQLIFSGVGPDFDVLRDAAMDLGDRVRFLGYVSYDEAPAVYRSADLFVSPTYTEGFSNTILEAMATGLPIISTRAVGVVDCLNDGVNSLLVEPKNVAGLAAAMDHLLSDGDLRGRLARVALADVRSLYSWSNVAASIEREYVGAPPVQLNEGWLDVVTPDPTCRFRRTPHLL